MWKRAILLSLEYIELLFQKKYIYIYIYRERERELKPINVIGDCPLCHSLNL